ncbi:HD-GYP domain-containing protein [Pseudoalteromonas sp.]|uniref:HD-GYP domain-containing protein n=1 Tax=Pseudoalteromonas sp. TaxID=53249 RepID=UPI003564D1DF
MEDICNEFGVLLVPRGTCIERRVISFLTGHKMQKALDNVIGIEGSLTSQTLLEDIHNFILSYPDLSMIHSGEEFEAVLQNLCCDIQIPRVLLQKLTVLKVQMPDIYQQTLFCSWFGAMIAREMGLPYKKIYNTFLTGLFHDLGLLHVQPDTLKKTGNFNDSEWHSIECHTFISKLIVESVNVFDSDITKGIMQHHERCDGTGYPNELTKEKLCYTGQIIGLADILYHIRSRQFSILGRNMADIMPYLQVNSNTFLFESYQAVYAIIHRSNLAVTDLLNRKDFPTLPKRLAVQRTKLEKLCTDLTDFINQINEISKKRHCKSLIYSSSQIFDIITRSGIGSTEIVKWLEELDDSSFDHNHAELQEIDAMQYELLWMIKRTCRLIPAILKDEISLSNDHYEDFKKIAIQIEQDLHDAWENYEH